MAVAYGEVGERDQKKGKNVRPQKINILVAK